MLSFKQNYFQKRKIFVKTISFTKILQASFAGNFEKLWEKSLKRNG